MVINYNYLSYNISKKNIRKLESIKKDVDFYDVLKNKMKGNKHGN